MSIRIVLSYAFALIRRLPEKNLENFFINRFGKALYAMFFEDYTEKLWGRHPREISAEWGESRVKGLSIWAVLSDMLGRLFRIARRNVETSLVEQFLYPKYGPGQLWTMAADEIRRMGGSVLTGKNAAHIECSEIGCVLKVVCTDGSAYPCDVLISSMPVIELVRAMDGVPMDVMRVAEGLPYRNFQIVGVLLPIDKLLLRKRGKTSASDGITQDCWIYVQDTSVKLGRIQLFKVIVAK